MDTTTEVTKVEVNGNIKKKYPEQWTISYKDLKFHIKPTGFKHTGLFPEQAANWEWSMDKIRNAKDR